MERSALKRRAHDIIISSNPRVITVGLVYLLVCLILEELGSRVLSVNISQSEAMNYLNYVSNGNYDYALSYAETMSPPATAYLIDFLLRQLKAIVSAGFVLFLLNTARNNKPAFGNLLDGFGFWLPILLLNLLRALLVSLWGLLLVVPGIIASYRYSQALYLLIDDPKKTPLQCLRESKAMMQGHKAELFKLDLSFIGWFLLSLIPVVGYAVRVWATPYFLMTRALYYEQLRGNKVWSFTPGYNA